MLTVYLHEIQTQMRSMRFQVSLLVRLLFFVANGVIYALKIERDVAEISRIDSEFAEKISEVSELNGAIGRWYRLTARSTGTEFITEGGANWFSDTYWVNAQSGNRSTEYGRSRTTNHWIRRFEIVDWTLIVRLILSFLCVVMAYDLISGGHEQGVLRLTMANPISRGAYLAGRALAQFSMLMVAAALGATVSLLILVTTGVLTLDAHILRGILLFFLGSSFYVAAFLLLSAGVSALTRSSATSLVVLMLTWAVLTVVIPQTAYLYGMQTVDFDYDWNDKQWDLRNETENALAQDGISLRDSGRKDFFAQAIRHREAIRQFLSGRDADDADSPHVLFLPDYVSKKPLDSKLIPHFQQVPLSTADGVAAGVVPIVILILEAALGFFFAFTAFLRMELAGGS